MERLIKKYSTTSFLVLLLILSIFTFWRMLKPGIFSMQDFHFFRLYEYHKCILDLQIPCRWSPDVAFEYGQPLFNFYGQLPYIYGELFRLLGFSVIDTTKILFASSLIISALGMFLLAKQLWKNNLAALLCAIIYIYAPYRAVDVFVRGALSECFAFVFFPLIIYFFNDYIIRKKITSLLLFSLTLTGLVLTHNLSVLMLAFFIIPWGIYIIRREKSWREIPFLLLAGIITFGISAFYILPVVGESHLITLDKTTQGYFFYKIHFTTLKQLLISRYWDYGASTWGNYDHLSLSVGHAQWIIPMLIAIFLTWKRGWNKYSAFFVLFFIGWGMLWLTHNKSIILWEIVPGMSYLQFPWRFLGLAVFSFSLASGTLVLLISKDYLKKILVTVIVIFVIGMNIPFFFEDLWHNIKDNQLFSGYRYNEIISSSIHDYWPIYAKQTPVKRAPQDPIFINGVGDGSLIYKKSNEVSYRVNVASMSSEISFPIVYFPGWTGYANSSQLDIYPSGELGLITARILYGDNNVKFIFTNTLIRSIGNYISLVSVIIFVLIFTIFFLRERKIKNEH